MQRPPSPIEPTRTFWVGTTILASLLVGGFSLCWHLPAPPPKVVQAAPSRIGHARLDGSSTDQVLREEALLRDPTPLFLPTEWSAAAAVRPESVLREPGERWGGFTARFAFSDEAAQVDLPLPSKPPEGALDALRTERWDMPFLGWGQREVKAGLLGQRGAYIAVVAVRDGRSVLVSPLEASPVGNADWAPIEWLTAVEPQGPSGSPALLKSSGVEAIDRFYLDYLEKNWRLGDRLARLAPGFYHITLGP